MDVGGCLSAEVLIGTVLGVCSDWLGGVVSDIVWHKFVILYLTLHSYEERAKNFETVIQQHVDFTMFEDFAANVFAPVLPQNATSMFLV